jgi:arginine deiminase
MSWRARRQETLLSAAIYRFHPRRRNCRGTRQTGRRTYVGGLGTPVSFASGEHSPTPFPVSTGASAAIAPLI